ncbi:hypothetical protein Tco_1334793 [Tanacetum coccineum]
METFAPNDKTDYYSGITSITVNGKNAYELKENFFDDLHNNAFNETKGSVEHIEYYLKVIGPNKLPNVDHDKLRVVVFPISLAEALCDYWKMGGDEIEVSDDESPDLEEYYSDKEETAKIFKIETDVFDYETPLCLAFNEFNYLLKVDPDLLTKDIMGHGLIMEYGRNQNQSNILANLSTIKLGVQNGQPVVRERMVIVMEEICPELTILETRSINKTLNGLISDDESSNDCWKRWKSHEIYYYDYDKGEYENETHEEGHKLCGIKTREVPVCQIKRYKMIKYSFNDEEEYVFVTEDEYDDLIIISEEACRGPCERNINEYWWRIYKSEDLEVLESINFKAAVQHILAQLNSTWRIYRANIRGVTHSNSF